ncbi:DUF5374 domain-containing protein [Pasteurella multocida]|uniref:DUF5374 domain-containing protein n=1 Tax=Pasteurella multocida TaxID=747 RepID=UPI000DFDB8CC|nr:DUF5374 domain-containing protein [Pasteurella multocida]SUB37825.1 membrane protein [Pasteurella multocida]HDR0635481.1 DUF5374 domain-containing protein [Pasteurella multocida]HDR1226894.1 DUF5374 domain-containing protein [Pasteurella multocida]HDR1239947.1 DUF5374 domain-containing protein [Pasteurella multocida]
MIFYYDKGMSLPVLLMALMLSSGIFLSTQQWLSYQRQRAIYIYQHVQALQIAQNQKQRQFLGLACENNVKRNDLVFQIQCTSQHVKVSTSLAEISL